MDTSTMLVEKSTHECPVFTFYWNEVEKHPDADTLGILKIKNSEYTYVLKLDDWKDKDGCLVAWLSPDTLISCKYPQVAFLAADAKYGPDKDLIRIKARRLRGVISFGLLCPLPADCGLSEGGDAREYFKTDWYDPEVMSLTGEKLNVISGDIAKGPSNIVAPRYDVDALHKYGKVMFQYGEPVLLMEKLEGCNSKYTYVDGQMYCSSRENWKKEFSEPPKLNLEELIVKMKDEAKAKEVYERATNNFQPKKSLWWEALDKCPELRSLCEANPGYVVYAEVFGNVKKFFYGNSGPKLMIGAFDILKPDGQWMDAEPMLEMFDKYKVSTAPVLYRAKPFDFDEICAIVADMTSRWPGAEKQIAEGICVRPMIERRNPRLGRVHLKVKNPKYLEMKG